MPENYTMSEDHKPPVTVELSPRLGESKVFLDGHDITMLVRKDGVQVRLSNGKPYVTLDLMPNIASVQIIDGELVVEQRPKLKALEALRLAGIKGDDATTSLDILIRRLVGDAFRDTAALAPDARLEHVVSLVGSDAVRAFTVLAWEVG